MSAVWSPVSRSPSVRTAVNTASMGALSSLVYQSRATTPLSEADLQRLIASAQIRNSKEGVTGLLVYDEGRFLQWLEGPAESLDRVWKSIYQDSRHTEITLLGASTTPVRFFGSSPMVLGKRRDDGVGGAERISELCLPPQLIETLYQSPQAARSLLATLAPHAANEAQRRVGKQRHADPMSLRALVDGVVIPELLARHARPVTLPPVIDPRAAELATLLLAVQPKAAFALIDTLRADGRSITQLCAGLFEPAARALGNLWRSDDCSEYEVTQALGHLQVALHRVSFETPSGDMAKLALSVPHTVLVAPTPHEPHLLGSVIASEIFWRAGWEVSCEFPESDAALNQLLQERWFDVLDLSLSGAFTREHRLPAMEASIRAAHAHSLNPALTVIVDGRVFFENAQAHELVGADSGAASAIDVAAATQMQAKASSASSRKARPLNNGVTEP